jgi:RNA methyltransferase, TrmH family
MAERIGTPSKTQLKQWKKLSLAKYRRREGLFLAEGGKVVAELLGSGRPVQTLLVSDASAEKWQRLLEGVPAGISVYRLTAAEWEGLSQDPSPEGVMAVAAALPALDPTVRLSTETGPLLLLDQVNNPNNLGALFRTAHWFGFRTVLLGEGSCEATNPKAIRTSMGSLFHLAVIEHIDFDALLPEIRRRFRIIGSDVRQGAAPHPCGGATALLMGGESHGLPEELLAQTDERWRIPGAGGAESLSLPQAAAILMYECVRKTDLLVR